jgi:hypothetical protein
MRELRRSVYMYMAVNMYMAVYMYIAMYIYIATYMYMAMYMYIVHSHAATPLLAQCHMCVSPPHTTHLIMMWPRRGACRGTGGTGATV